MPRTKKQEAINNALTNQSENRSPEEVEKILQERRTSGRKGMKSPRINIAFGLDNHEYIRIMSRVRGETMTDFVNAIIADHMKNHMELFEQARAICRSMDEDH